MNKGSATNRPLLLPGRWLGIFGALVLGAARAFAAPPTDERCPAEGATSRLDEPLPRASQKVRSGGEFVVVAIGSSSTVGVGATRPGGYPRELEADLTSRLSNLSVRVLNKGVSGETLRQMLQRFDRDVLAFHPDLVVWQLGTNAIMTEEGVTQDADLVREGVERLKASGADVILMSPQYSPKVLQDPDCAVMVRLLDQVARVERVPVFHRFEVMRDWVVSGQEGFANILAADGLHLNDFSYRCLAAELADAIVEDVRPAVCAAPERPRSTRPGP